MKEFGHKPQNGIKDDFFKTYACKCSLCGEEGEVTSRRAGMNHRYGTKGLAPKSPCKITYPDDNERNPRGYWNSDKDRHYTCGEMRKEALEEAKP